MEVRLEFELESRSAALHTSYVCHMRGHMSAAQYKGTKRPACNYNLIRAYTHLYGRLYQPKT